MTEEFELFDNRTDIAHDLDVKKLISPYEMLDGYTIAPCNTGQRSGHPKRRVKTFEQKPFCLLKD